MNLGLKWCGLALLAVTLLTAGCGGGGDSSGGLLAPRVVATSPEDNATSTPTSRRITATFSKAMAPATLTVDSFQASSPTGQLAGTVSYSGLTATLLLTEPLPTNTLISAKVTQAATDVAGHQLQNEHNWTFTTGESSDDTRPTVASTDPAAGENGVSLNKSVSATFSEALNPATVTSDTFTVQGPAGPIVGNVTVANNVVLFDPASDFARNTAYTATLTTGIQDLSDNALANAKSWTFTTGTDTDTTGPQIMSVDPGVGATGVLSNKNITATFNENMNGLTIRPETFFLQRPDGSTVATTHSYADKVAKLDPVEPLASNTLYTATLTRGAQDLAGNALLAEKKWSFTTGSFGDTTGPQIISVDPGVGATGVLTNKSVTATFNESMNGLTIRAETFFLQRPDNTIVPTTHSYADKVAKLDPVEPLAPNTVYTATLTRGAQDLAGNALLADKKWSFTTGTSADNTRPSVTSVSPGVGETGVALNRNVVAAFNERIAADSVNENTFTLRSSAGQVAGVASVVNNVVQFNPTNDLGRGTVFTATLTTGIKDMSGNSMAAAKVWSFTTGITGDGIAPTILAVDPDPGETNVPLNKNVSVTFSEVMDVTTLEGDHFFMKTASGITVLTTHSYANKVAVLDPVEALSPNSVYTVTMTRGATDASGNPLNAEKKWSFTTGSASDATRPKVSATDPAKGAIAVALNKSISAEFTETINPSSINASTFRLASASGLVAGTVSIVNNVAQLNPNASLKPNTDYTATLTTGVKDMAGNKLAVDYAWTFVTGTIADSTAPRVLSTDPAAGATGVPPNQNITVSFSEVMDVTTLEGANFFMKRPDGTTVLTTHSYADKVAMLDPVENLASNTVYTVTMTRGAKDAAGNALVAERKWSFTTSGANENVPPTVLSTFPAASATNVKLNQSVSARFSEAMRVTSIQTNNFSIAGVNGTVTYNPDTHIATFNPSSDLSPNTTYTVTIRQEVKDSAGNMMVADKVWSFQTGTTRVPGGINLGTATTYAVLAGSTVTNSGPTVLNGDLGVSPGTAITGFPPGQVNGAIHAGDAQAAQAKADLLAGQLEAASRPGALTLPGDLSGLTFTPGVYKNSTSVMLSSGAVTLDAQGDPNAVFIFQMGSTLTTSPGTQVVLAGGARAANIYWSVGTSATLGVNSIFKGIVLAEVSITVNNGAVSEGTFLTKTGAVTLAANTVTRAAVKRP